MAFGHIKRIAIAGVGLIGGSAGLALKKAGFHGTIVGLVRREEAVKQVTEAGAVDFATLDFEEALTDANLLLISTPVDVIPVMTKKALEYAPDGCIFTDVGSTKQQLVNEVEKLMPENKYFVGAHPMAGSEKTGVSAAYASLFENSKCIITRTKSSNPEAVELVSKLWKSMGARVELMSPEEHDHLIATASHLPQVMARALVLVADGVENDIGKAIDYAATGFADATRTAAGSPEVWKSILLHNADNISNTLDVLSKELAEMRKILDDRDGEKLMEKLEKARRIKIRSQAK